MADIRKVREWIQVAAILGNSGAKEALREAEAALDEAPPNAMEIGEEAAKRVLARAGIPKSPASESAIEQLSWVIGNAIPYEEGLGQYAAALQAIMDERYEPVREAAKRAVMVAPDPSVLDRDLSDALGEIEVALDELPDPQPELVPGPDVIVTEPLVGVVMVSIEGLSNHAVCREVADRAWEWGLASGQGGVAPTRDECVAAASARLREKGI